MSQRRLFTTPLPAGLEYRANFLSQQEEGALLEEIVKLPLQAARYKEFTARRRIVSYGGTYDFSDNELLPAGPIPAFLQPLRERIADWAGVPASWFNHALIAEYKTGTPLGWHRDVHDFEIVAGISLGGAGRMRLRRYPHVKGSRETLSLELEPRSAYLLRAEARWGWQHSIPPTKNLRYSLTFRTRAGEAKLH
jgi:alkylated DNA repair dioxygenase AlkB